MKITIAKTVLGVQPGGHPTIPRGKIIATPQSNGSYSLSVYHGIHLGWVRAGEVPSGQDVQAAMQKLVCPIATFTPNSGSPAGQR